MDQVDTQRLQSQSQFLYARHNFYMPGYIDIKWAMDTQNIFVT